MGLAGQRDGAGTSEWAGGGCGVVHGVPGSILCVNMVGCMLACIDHGPCRKMADEPGGLRGVEQVKVEAAGGSIIGQKPCGSSKEPAVRGGRGATGLGNACTAGCGVLLSMPP